MKLVSQRTLEVNGTAIEVSYNKLTSKITVSSGGIQIYRKYLWLPYGNYRFELADVRYTLRVWMLPFCQFSLYGPDGVVCNNVFPKLKRYSLVMMAMSPVRHTLMLLAWAIS
ncbi:hypothetical protein CWE12_03085 [Aliidiomarina sedimenti]|uniref:Uncharacterized protein n=1 Tax=Aliidiomarina sedimenti TaxID=1933879 RepID=A0ABY0C3F0_9GAMM|nr:hypothetical protein [Aliidiomarina sedimenti]RUO31990.1 hypothetical protein CWE12_03085 [Aliidiomarina sedimenti]